MIQETIKPQDLRLGNWIIENLIGESRYIRVQEIQLGDWSDCSPIPLSSDILLKAGFEQINVFDCRVWEFKKDGVSLIGLDEYEFKDGELYELAFNYGEVGKPSHRQVALNYVHQLQNLFWILTGTELSIDL